MGCAPEDAEALKVVRGNLGPADSEADEDDELHGGALRRGAARRHDHVLDQPRQGAADLKLTIDKVYLSGGGARLRSLPSISAAPSRSSRRAPGPVPLDRHLGPRAGRRRGVPQAADRHGRGRRPRPAGRAHDRPGGLHAVDPSRAPQEAQDVLPDLALARHRRRRPARQPAGLHRPGALEALRRNLRAGRLPVLDLLRARALRPDVQGLRRAPRAAGEDRLPPVLSRRGRASLDIVSRLQKAMQAGITIREFRLGGQGGEDAGGAPASARPSW